MTGTLDGTPRASATAVTVSVVAGTASTDDFAAVPDFTLTIAAGRSSGTATFVLTPVDDAIDEDDETVRVSGTVKNLAVTAGTGTVQNLTVTAGTVTIEDDDERGIEVSATALTVPEGDSRTYTVVLETLPTGPVTVTPSVSGSPDVTVRPAALTFTAQSWDRAQTVTVSAAQDADAENDTATVSHAVSGGDYDSVTAPDVAVTVEDDETPSAAVALTASPGTVDEDAGATTIEVTGTLDGAPRTSATAVTVSVVAGTASTDDFAAVPEFTLTIPAGRISGTATFVLTPLDDSIDEHAETVTVSGTAAGLTVQAATLTIVNSDPLPRSWIARFGRTVAEQLLQAVDTRMSAPPKPGVEAHIGGHRVGGAAVGPESATGLPNRGRGRILAGRAAEETDPNRPRAVSRTVTGRELLTGSSFALTAKTDDRGVVSLWGRGATTRFNGSEDRVYLDGEVTSGMLGADWTRGDATAGLILSHSSGTGSYRGASDSGTVSSFVNGLFPWGRYALNERLTVWGVAGYGAGEITLTPAGRSAIRTDMDLAMGAAGLRGVAVEAPAEGGVELSMKTDAMAVRTGSEETRVVAAAQADVTRLRLGLEGSWRGLTAGTGTLVPRLELGVRHDGGDAETGFGLDLGGGLSWSDPESGLSAELQGRGLLTHESKGFRDRGLSGSFAWAPGRGSGRGSGRGPSLTLVQTMGVSPSGGVDALLGLRHLGALAANDDGDELENRRLELRGGYGFAVLEDRFTWTPEAGLGQSNGHREYTLGWRLARVPRGGGIGSLELAFEATRREAAVADDNAPPEHGVRLGLTARW